MGKRGRDFLLDHGVALLLYLLLTLGLTWPTAPELGTALTGTGADTRYDLWQLWHVKRALGGEEPWFRTSLLSTGS